MRAHLLGIAGAGMRALADVLLARGWQLSGSDLCLHAAAGILRAGVRLYAGHAAEHLDPATDLVIASAAVPRGNPERRRAAELGIPVYSYFQMLGRLTEGQHVLAVAGTHGKSTSTAMAAQILVSAGRDPTVLCGAAPRGQPSGGRAGGEDLSIVEACEYRANFLHLRPQHAVILAIEPDHFDCYPSVEDLHRAFAQFAGSVPCDGLVLAQYGCPVLQRIAADLPCRVATFGITAHADWSARNPQIRQGRYQFDLWHGGRPLTKVRLQVPGRHNVLDALGAAALAWENGAKAADISTGLANFPGLARRLEVLGTFGGITVLDDYAHHPTEVAAALQAVRQAYPARRLWCVFQPHQALRTARLLDEFAESLQNADRVMVSEIFRAREGPYQNGEVTAADLARRVKTFAARARRRRPNRAKVAPCHAPEEIIAVLQARLRPGDVLISMGAGDIRNVAESVKSWLQRHLKVQEYYGVTDGVRRTVAAG